VGLTRFAPRRIERALMSALEGRPAEIDRFLGALAGIEPADRYFGARNVLRRVGTSACTGSASPIDASAQEAVVTSPFGESK
jgi:hypothetical protein